MTRRDFVLIAEVISRSDIPADARATLAQAFAVRLKAENPNFDVARFVAAAMS